MIDQRGVYPAELCAHLAAQAVTDAASGSAEVDIGPRSPSRRNKAHVWFQDDCSVLSQQRQSRFSARVHRSMRKQSIRRSASIGSVLVED